MLNARGPGVKRSAPGALADRSGMDRVIYDSTVQAATVEHDLRLLLR